MTKRKFKVLTDMDGKEYRFSSLAFKNCIRKKVLSDKDKGIKSSGEIVKSIIAEKLCVSVDAVKNWQCGHNGPADIEMVKEIASVLEIEYKELLEEEKMMLADTTQMLLPEFPDMSSTKDVIRIIYHKMVDFMHSAEETCCFQGEFISEAEYWGYCSYYDELVKLIHKSMLDIPECIYNDLLKIVEVDFKLYLCGIDAGVEIWDTCEYLDFVEEKGYTQWEERSMREYFRRINDDFYKNIREILKDYIASYSIFGA